MVRRQFWFRLVFVTGTKSVWQDYTFRGTEAQFLTDVKRDRWVKTIEFKTRPLHPAIRKFYDRYNKRVLKEVVTCGTKSTGV